MNVIDTEYWRYFVSDVRLTPLDNYGKWMFHYSSDGRQQFAEEMCRLAVEQEVVTESKCSNISRTPGSGVACFYLSGDDTEGHVRVIRFFMEHDMIQRTKAGRLFNISFKLDEQTRAGEYGNDYVPTIRLSDFVDLNTGEFIG